MAAGPTYESIATTTLGSAASSIDFTSITNTWTDIRLVLVTTTSAGSSIRMRFNSDSGTNYSRTYILGDGAIADSGTNATQSSINSPSSASTTIPTMTTVNIFSYAGSTYKTILMTSSSDLNGSGTTGNTVGLWRSTSAITSVNLFLGSGNFAIGTTATLYGIKAA